MSKHPPQCSLLSPSLLGSESPSTHVQVTVVYGPRRLDKGRQCPSTTSRCRRGGSWSRSGLLVGVPTLVRETPDSSTLKHPLTPTPLGSPYEDRGLRSNRTHLFLKGRLPSRFLQLQCPFPLSQTNTQCVLTLVRRIFLRE